MSLQDTTRTVLKSLVVTSPARCLTIDQLDRDYEKQEGRRIPYAQLGYANLKSFLFSLSDILAYDSAKRTFTLASNAGGKSEHIQKLVSEQKSNRRTSNNSKSFKNSNNSKRVNNNSGKNSESFNNNRCRNGEIKIWDHSPHDYNSNYSQINLTPNALPTNPRPFEPGHLLVPPGYVRGSLLGALPVPLLSIPLQRPAIFPSGYVPPHQRPKNIFKKMEKNDKTKKQSASNKVEPSDLKKPDEFDNGKSDSSSEEIDALPPIDDDDPINFIGIKMTNSKYGRTIPTATIPKILKPGHVQQIYVTEVTKFPYFYFQFASTDHTMRGLQEQLNLTYDEENNDLIRRSEVQIGNVCAAYYADKWSRAEILSHDSDRLKLLFVDYGTIDYVPIEQTRHLYAQLCEPSRLCHRGALSFLKPLWNAQLEKKIVKIFCEMVAGKSLIAVLTDVDEIDGICVTLVDTSDAKVDLIVNKILMESL